MGIAPDNRVVVWLADRARLTPDQMLRILSSGLPGIAAFDDLRLTHDGLLRVQIMESRPHREKRFGPCPLTLSPTTKWLSTGALTFASLRWKRRHGRTLLRNFIDVVLRFDVVRVRAHVHGGRSYAYAQAGFLPASQKSWMALASSLRKRFAEHTGYAHIPDGIRNQFEDVFASRDERSLRLITAHQDPRLQPPLVTQLPAVCRDLLLAVDWLGVLELEDNDVRSRYDAFVGAAGP